MIMSMLRFLQKEGRFVFVLASFLLILGVSSFFTDQGFGRWLVNIVFSLLLLASLYAVSDNRRVLVIGSGVCAAGLGLRWFAFFYPNPVLHQIGSALQLLFMLAAATAMLVYVLKRERVTFDTISAALSVYLLFGIAWSVAYSALEEFEPGSFLLQGEPVSNVESAKDRDGQSMRWIYYSYVTLTTLGYGDIVPANERAQGLVVLEAVVGQLYLTVLVARLVGLHIAHASRHKGGL